MKNKKIKLNKSGFTLIELIVSITIIAVITVVASVSFVGVGRKSRDARRMADLEKIRVALEMAKQQGTGATYPSSLDQLVTAGFLSATPLGPKGVGDTYVYTRPTIYTYTLQTAVENVGSSNVPGGIYQLTQP